MKKDYLPIGSVILLKGGNKRLMICGRVQNKGGSDEIYDYTGCYYPEGVLHSDEMFFFNNDSIETIYFIGFQDEEELHYRDILGNLGELELRDGKLVQKK